MSLMIVPEEMESTKFVDVVVGVVIAVEMTMLESEITTILRR